MEKHTPLYFKHVEAGGRLVSFAGYKLPVRYNSIIKEHIAVRESVGIFDVSHMGEICIKGREALKLLQYLTVSDISSLQPGQIKYTLMTNESGGVVDDVLIYANDYGNYIIVVNAANRNKDYKWILKHQKFTNAVAEVLDRSDEFAQIAIQGPKSKELLSKLCDFLPEKYYTFNEHAVVLKKPCTVSRTGYTGEDGYEIYCDTYDAEEIWDALIKLGAVPCGLGARDTLRFEACMPLYGHELTDSISPLEARLGFFVDLDGEDFLGKDVLVKQKAEGITRRRCGLKLLSKGIARENSLIFNGDRQVGVVTSGIKSPTLGESYAMAFVEKSLSLLGTRLTIDVRGKKIPAQVVKMPFYKRKKKK